MTVEQTSSLNDLTSLVANGLFVEIRKCQSLRGVAKVGIIDVEIDVAVIGFEIVVFIDYIEHRTP